MPRGLIGGTCFNGDAEHDKKLNDGSAGYDHMQKTIDNYHGISWHNYWHLGREAYTSCENGGYHVSWYFTDRMKTALRNGKPAIITEADLLSDEQGGNIPDKNAHDPQAIADSLRHFFHSEWLYGSNASQNYGQQPDIALWLLNDNTTHADNFPPFSQGGNENAHEHDWHEAYKETIVGTEIVYTVTPWFEQWYTGAEPWQPQFRVFLNGPYSPIMGLMHDDLRSKNLVPLTSPYAVPATTDANVLAATGGNAIVDWVTIELHAASNYHNVVALQSALLQRDGTIVGVDGMTPPDFNNFLEGSYFVLVNHRNHLAAMTAQPVYFAKGTTVDFSDPALATWGANAQHVRTRANGATVRALWAGNANGDNAIIAAGPNNDQIDIVLTVVTSPGYVNKKLNHIVYGYQDADLDLNGETIKDAPNNDVNVLLTTIFSHPDNYPNIASNYIVQEQLPSGVTPTHLLMQQ